MNNIIVVPGSRATPQHRVERDILEKFGLTIETVESVRVGQDVRGRQQSVELTDVADDDVVEFEYADGVREWMQVDSLRERTQATTRGTAGDNLIQLDAFSDRKATRGTAETALQTVQLLKLDPVSELVDLAAEAVAEVAIPKLVKYGIPRLEERFLPYPGLYRLDEVGKTTEQVTESLPAGNPYLVLIHGAFSNTAGSFGDLMRSSQWHSLKKSYGDRLLGLNHRSLSESPIDNALALAEALPAGARIHLLTHSRGGLVGEFMCLNQELEGAIKPFELAGRQDDLKKLEQLIQLVQARQFRIERFVRVACPARGTPLASNRLDRYLSLMLNVIGLIPAVDKSVIYPFAKAGILTLIKQRADPAILPGLEALMPTSPLISLLNRPDLTSSADLAVVAGDIEGQGLFGRLKVFAADMFFREEHDLIVNTASMREGIKRSNGVHYALQRGPEISHFSYFSDDSGRSQVQDWLTRSEGASAQGFEKVKQEEMTDLRTATHRSTEADDRPIVFLIPDFMATHLKVDDQRVWLNRSSLTAGGFQTLAMSQDNSQSDVGLDGIVAYPYQDLVDHLDESGFEARPFPYDWRHSVLDVGADFSREIEEVLDNPDRLVYLLGHGMGGLVARAVMIRSPETWNKLVERGGHLVMLGTPNRGSYQALRLLTGDALLAKQLAVLDPSRSIDSVLKVLRTFQGLLELVPEHGALESLSAAWWQSKQFKCLMRKARQDQLELRKAVDPQHMSYIAGNAASTPGGIELDEKGLLGFTVTSAGDGVVSHDLSELADVPTWCTEALHGDLARNPLIIRALPGFLRYGDTHSLTELPLVRESGAYFDLQEAEMPMFPSEPDLLDAAIVGDVSSRVSETVFSLGVSVVHGSLENARNPVAVGHYQGDMLVGSEAFLDHMLDGRLSARRDMGIYAGPVGSTELILVPKGKPPGGLVVGLGSVGMITPEILTAGIMDAALRYAMVVSEQPCPTDTSKGWRSAAFSAVLIGTNGGRALSIESSVSAIVAGAIHANRNLRKRGLWEKVRIDHVEFVELYQDVAIHAAHTVRDLAERHLRIVLENGERVNGARHLITRGGGFFRRPTSDYDSGWWRWMKITEKTDTVLERHLADESPCKARELEFLLLTDRARAEITLQPTQRNLVDQLVNQAIRNPVAQDLAATLYQLMLPNALKDLSYEMTNLMLVVDSAAAQYPWEMLSQRRRDKLVPLAIDMGMIRQLTTETFRAQVEQPTGNHALIIGEPNLGNSMKFSRLDGARQEAQAVHDLLLSAGRNEYELELLLGSESDRIVAALYARDYRILHIAGHGVYEAKNPMCSGVVIGENTYLTAAEIRQLQVVPELVFLNCCHLAKPDADDSTSENPGERDVPPWNRLAASIAEELIRGGVRAVVAAGWAVRDDAARDFAKEFYQQMLDGQPFGEAVLQARKNVYEEYPGTNTWGAYQCYGDAGYQLPGTSRATRSSTLRPVAPDEVIRRLEEIERNAKNADYEKDNREQDLEEVNRYEDNIPTKWKSGKIWYKFALAYSELGEYEKAIECYSKALKKSSEDDEVPIRALEQVANLRTRYADEIRTKEGDRVAVEKDNARGKKTENERIEQQLYEACCWLEKAIAIDPHPERHALMGGISKRRARAAGDPIIELQEAMKHYGKAHQEQLDREKQLNPYYTLQWITYRMLLDEHSDENVKKEMLDQVKSCQGVAKNLVLVDPNFWNRNHVPDALLLHALIDDDLTQQENIVQEEYMTVLRLGASVRERRTVIDHITFLSEMLGKLGYLDANSEALNSLFSLQQSIVDYGNDKG